MTPPSRRRGRGKSSRRTVTLACCSAVLLCAVGCSGGGSDPGPTRPTELQPSPATGQGIGDAYYADDGNLGYDVSGYHVRLTYDPDDASMKARTVIRAVASAYRLSSFHLDLLGLEVTAVTVDGGVATFTRTDAHELVVTPRKPIAPGADFRTRVTYHGKPGVDPVGGVRSGWFDAATPGGGFIAGEPHSCTLWYPCNDHPTDKATFRLTATVPKPFKVVSVGAQGATTSATLADGTAARTFRWVLAEPTATYLTTIYIDQLTFERSTLADGTPVVSAYGPHPEGAPGREAKLPEILDVLADAWGPYPAPQAGGIFVNGDVPFSLETFTRPIYTEGADVETIVHENAHQWWGDNVSIRRWKDICLNECLASYSVWLWHEAHGADLDARYHAAVDRGGDWLSYPLYDMGPGHEFDGPGVYYKGTFFLHALRRKLGDEAFFSALRGIQHDYDGGNLSMNGLRDQLESRSGTDLTSFWDEWVIHTGKPSPPNLYPGPL